MSTTYCKSGFKLSADGLTWGNLIKPKSLKVSGESVASATTGRDFNGIMHVEYIKSNLRKIEVELAPADASVIAPIIKAVQGQIYYIMYFDPYECEDRVAHVYTSTSSSDCYSGIIGANGLWQGVTFNAIEIGD